MAGDAFFWLEAHAAGATGPRRLQVVSRDGHWQKRTVFDLANLPGDPCWVGRPEIVVLPPSAYLLAMVIPGRGDPARPRLYRIDLDGGTAKALLEFDSEEGQWQSLTDEITVRPVDE